MANLVEITIRGDDNTGPAFASVLARGIALKAALKDVGSIGLNVDQSKMGATLSALKSKIQSLGIADIADVNIPSGRLFAQMQLLHRMIGQSGISDILDFNLNDSALNKQLDKLHGLTETIPVLFDVSKIPDFGDTHPIINVPVKFDVSNIPQVGDVQSLKVAAIAEEALARATEDAGHASRDATLFWQGAVPRLEDFANRADEGVKYMSMFGDSLLGGAFDIGLLGTTLAYGANLVGKFGTAVFQGMTRNKGFQDSISQGIPVMNLAIGRFGFLRGGIDLFGGALKNIGIPAFIASASGLHIMAEAIVEVGATLIPAAIAFAVFGAAAIPTIGDIRDHMVAAHNAAVALNVPLPGLKTSFDDIANAVQPEVYNLFGEAVYIANQNTGTFTGIAVAGGKALDQLAARFTIAATTGSGFSQFIRNAATDLSGWGNLIGNIGGIIGNLISVMPGYAELLLNFANGFTHLAESITGNGIARNIIGIGLAAHGAIFYLGLISTLASVLISRLLPGIASTALGAAVGLEGLGAAGAVASGGLEKFAFGVSSAAALPWGWITLAATAVGILIYELDKATTASGQYTQAARTALASVPVSQLGIDLTKQQTSATKQLADMQSSLGAAAGVQIPQLLQVLNVITGQKNLIQEANNQIADQKALVQQLGAAQHIYTVLLHESNGNLDMFNQAGISSTDIMNAAAEAVKGNLTPMKILEQEMRAAQGALDALSLGTGRYAAAVNAQTNEWMSSGLPTMQKVIQAEDNLITMVTGGRSAFDAFQQSIQGTSAKFQAPSGLSEAAKATGASFSGLNEQSLALGNTFYNITVPALQKTIGALESQNIATGDLQKVVATGAAEMLRYTGGNTEANSVIVSLINNALGPGTVSLKTLNTWVKNNATSMDGMNSIIAKSTIAAGTLAGVLQSDLTQQFQADLLASSGAQRGMKNFTDAIVNGGTQTAKFKSARDQLIRDLENSGLSAQQATSYVNGLQHQISGLKGKAIGIDVIASGSGTVGYQTTSQGTSGFPIVKGNLKFFHDGGLVGGRTGTFGPDDQMAAVRTGEFVVNPYSTKKWLPFLRHINSFSSGGLVEPVSTLSNTPGGWMTGWGKGVEGTFAKDVIAGFRSAVKSMNPLPGGGGGYAGPGGGAPAANVALAQRILGWSGGQFADLVRLWTQESGWNQYAYNAGSGATGIPQALPYTKMPRAAWLPFQGGSANVVAQETWGNDYIIGRYGTPSAAWAHEVAYNWYDNGGWLKPGLTMAYNGTGRSERVVGPNDTMSVRLEISSGGQSAFDQFMANWMKKYVRLKGGGNVQTAFGKA